jgi:hypothetical protein
MGTTLNPIASTWISAANMPPATWVSEFLVGVHWCAGAWWTGDYRATVTCAAGRARSHAAHRLCSRIRNAAMVRNLLGVPD